MSKTDNNEHTDADILRCKGDAVRAREIISHTPLPAERANRKDAAKHRDSKEEKTEIPRFDLAEKIMAEQRKISAIRRKAPGQKAEAERSQLQAEPVGYTIEQPTPEQLEQNQIIAEIVARDIKRLCQGGTSNSRG